MSRRPRPDERSLRERGCTSKVRYDSPGEAELAALTRMLGNAEKPLAVYDCWYCPGFHLTSSGQESFNTVPIEAPVSQTSVFVALSHDIGRAGFRSRRHKWLREERIRLAQRRRRNREAKFFATNPPPTLASDEEVDAFFARHLKTA